MLQAPADLLRSLGLAAVVDVADGPGVVTKRCPATGVVLGRVPLASLAQVEATLAASHAASLALRQVPAPRRGEVLRAMGDAFREHKAALGALVSLETGKIRAEGEGEVQEIVDICDFAVGLSRTVGGRGFPSERPDHRLFEQWHPLGVVGVISAFNFPAAVWAWNAALAFVCGNTVVWKPSLKAPLTALACQHIVDGVLARFNMQGAMALVIGSDDVAGRALCEDRRVALVSATGSTRMGRIVQAAVQARFGKVLLELGGNNAVVVLPDADLDLALRAVVFGAVGTAGQRCTTTRRLLVHKDVAAAFTARLVRAYAQVHIGHPLDAGVLMGPLVDEDAVLRFEAGVKQAIAQGARVLHGGARHVVPGLEGCFVQPTLLQSNAAMPIVQEEIFAPVLHVIEVASLDEAIALNNAVPQGLSSSIFTRDLQSAERFLSAVGSDCGIANVNLGTSGAEIGGAFGGEKETGGGRESGSDAWKAYMRRQTCTINHGSALPLAQGITFEVQS